MYEKDYILRMIEMLGDLLRAIFGWIGKGKLEEAGDKINEAYLTFLRKDAGFFHTKHAVKDFLFQSFEKLHRLPALPRAGRNPPNHP